MGNKTAAFGMNVDRQAKLLVGRANAGDKLTKNEKKLLKQVGPLPTDNTYNKERFWASMPGRALKTGLVLGGTVGAGAAAIGTAKYVLPQLSKTVRAGTEDIILMLSGMAKDNKAVQYMASAIENGKGPVQMFKELSPKTKATMLASTVGTTAAIELAKPTLDRRLYPHYMQSQMRKDKKTDSGIDAQLRTQLKKNASTTELVLDNIDLLNQLPVGNPKKKEELLEALKKIENGSKAESIMNKIALSNDLLARAKNTASYRRYLGGKIKLNYITDSIRKSMAKDFRQETLFSEALKARGMEAAPAWNISDSRAVPIFKGYK